MKHQEAVILPKGIEYLLTKTRNPNIFARLLTGAKQTETEWILEPHWEVVDTRVIPPGSTLQLKIGDERTVTNGFNFQVVSKFLEPAPAPVELTLGTNRTVAKKTSDEETKTYKAPDDQEEFVVFLQRYYTARLNNATAAYMVYSEGNQMDQRVRYYSPQTFEVQFGRAVSPVPKAK